MSEESSISGTICAGPRRSVRWVLFGLVVLVTAASLTLFLVADETLRKLQEEQEAELPSPGGIPDRSALWGVVWILLPLAGVLLAGTVRRRRTCGWCSEGLVLLGVLSTLGMVAVLFGAWSVARSKGAPGILTRIVLRFAASLAGLSLSSFLGAACCRRISSAFDIDAAPPGHPESDRRSCDETPGSEKSG